MFIECPASPSAYAWTPYRQLPRCRRRGRSGRRWHLPEAGRTASPASPECQTGNRRSWSFACTGTPRFPISPLLPFLLADTEAIRQ